MACDLSLGVAKKLLQRCSSVFHVTAPKQSVGIVGMHFLWYGRMGNQFPMQDLHPLWCHSSLLWAVFDPLWRWWWCIQLDRKVERPPPGKAIRPSFRALSFMLTRECREFIWIFWRLSSRVGGGRGGRRRAVLLIYEEAYGMSQPEITVPDMYRDRLKGWYMVARNVFLLLLNWSAWPLLAVV